MEHDDIKIVAEIKSYIDLHGGDYPKWFVGRAEHPEEALITHGVNLELDHCIYLTAACLEEAKSVEYYFVTHLRTEGAAHSSSDKKALSVYAYEKSQTTRP